MATNLIHTNRSLITFDVASKISFIIGEPPAETQQAIETGVPTLAGIGRTRLILRVAHPDCSARLTTLDYRVIPTRILGAVGSATDGLLKTGSEFISSLLSDKAGTVANLIAGSYGSVRSSKNVPR